VFPLDLELGSNPYGPTSSSRREPTKEIAMPATDPSTVPADDVTSCALDGSCPPDAGCCDPAAKQTGSARLGLLAAGGGLACLLGCVAMAALGAGGLAAVTGALTGEIGVAVAAGVIVAAVVIVVRRRNGRIC
jgi:hypothetical protein